METLDLAVRLRAVGAGAFGADAELNAGVAPSERAIRRSVVGEDAFDGDAAISEPGDRTLENTDRGGSLLVLTDLDVSDPGVIIDHGVQERGAQQWCATTPEAP